MLFREISPFIRFARCLTIKESSHFLPCVPYDHRLFYVLDGIGKININNKTIELQKSGLVLIHSGIPYQLLNNNASYIALNFDYTKSHSHLVQPIIPANFKNVKNITVIEDVTFDDITELNSFLTLDRCRRIQNTLSSIVDIFTKSLPYHSMQTGALFTSALVDIFNKITARGASTDGFDINQIIQYIQEQYSTPIDNKSIGNTFNFHPNYISSEFKRCTGKPLHRYILDYRITKAISLLDEGQYDLKMVASKVGFSDYNYFSRYFTKVVGVSPKKYIQASPPK